MAWLVTLVLSSVSFNQTLRYGQLQKASVPHVIAMNYLAAAAMSLVLALVGGCDSPTLRTIGLGSLNGVLYFTHLFVLMKTFQIVGVGIANALVMSGCIIPIVVSSFLWPEEEVMTAGRWVAVGLTPIALVLMRPTEERRIRELSIGNDLVFFSRF